MSEEEYAQMPKLITENRRYACPDVYCNYVTLDALMLLAHMEHLHTEFKGYYKCPHCPTDLLAVAFKDLEFHLRCHAELLFKVNLRDKNIHTGCPNEFWTILGPF